MKTNHYLGNLKVRDILGDLHFVGTMIFKSVLKKKDMNMDWIHLAQDKTFGKFLCTR
jgi:hypothetical protein